jgi:hypothetical protein
VSEFRPLTDYDEIWLVDGRDYLTECTALRSCGEIWLVESRDSTTALVMAESEKVADFEFSNAVNHEETPCNSGRCDLLNIPGIGIERARRVMAAQGRDCTSHLGSRSEKTKSSRSDMGTVCAVLRTITCRDYSRAQKLVRKIP